MLRVKMLYLQGASQFEFWNVSLLCWVSDGVWPANKDSMGGSGHFNNKLIIY